MDNLKFDENNFRIHTDKNKGLISRSLVECGAGRSILFDSDNCIIAGNGVYEQAQALGIPVKVIESDGTELIAIKRTDLKTSDEKRKLLAMADNQASDTSSFDIDKILSNFRIDDLKAWEFDLPFDDLPVDIDGFFEGADSAEKKKKVVVCPHCGKEHEI